MGERIVFLGSSSTDGFTYPMLARQALAEAKKPAPTFINAGAGGNTTAEMLKRFDRDVVKHRPTKCVVQAGGNDATRKIPVADFTATLRTILQKLKDQRIAPVLLTLNCLPGNDAVSSAVADYNASIRELAREFECPVGDVYGAMKEAREKNQNIAEPDGSHPNYEGYRLMARVLLDVLGHADVAVPAVLKVETMPGLIAEWKISAVADKKTPPLTQEAVKSLTPNADWKTLPLPETEPATHWWAEQTRQEGFALSLKKLAGPAARYVGHAKIARAKAGSAFFNTGGSLQTDWLNGERIFKSSEWTGFHAGKERIPITLNAGENIFVIETGDAFFASITESDQW